MFFLSKKLYFSVKKGTSVIKNEEWDTQKVNNHDDTNTTILTTLFSLDDSSFHSVSFYYFKLQQRFCQDIYCG